MKNKKLTLTIGIPAYNEEANIKNLLQAIIDQKGQNFEINEIIVYSDASTDNTVSQVKSIKDSRINLVANNKRQGKNAVQNSIFKKASGDVLVILDADILPSDNYTLNNIAKTFLNNPGVSLVSGKVSPTKPINIISKAIAYSHNVKSHIFEKCILQNPIYLCNGRIMAYKKEFYKSTTIPEMLVADDAYFCLVALSSGKKIIYQPNSEVLYTVPSTIRDHIKQSARFYGGKKQLMRVFGKDFINNQYRLPTNVSFWFSAKGVLSEPKLSFIYFCLLIISIAKSLLPRRVANKFWETAKSSKKIIEKYV